MERRSCNDFHFIQVLRRGEVVKARNIDSRGKPAITFKKLRDIYDTENARGSVVKSESQCLPVVDRTLQAIEPENNKFGCYADGEASSQSDGYDSGEITLKQLKDRCKSKKRELATPSPTFISPKQEPEEDDDLTVPLSYLKSKISKKANAKRRRTNRNIFASPNEPMSIKAEVDLEPEASLHHRSDSHEVTEPIVETSESELSMSRNSESSDCSSNIWMLSKPNSGTVTCSEFPNLVDSDEKIPVLFAEEQLCALNQISNDLFEHVEPEHISPASEALAEVSNREDRCNTENTQNELFAPPRSTEVVATANNQSLDMHDCLMDYSEMDKSCGQSNNVGLHVPEATVNNSIASAGLDYADDVCLFRDGDKEVLLSNQKIRSVDGPGDQCISSLDKINDQEQPTGSCFTDAATSCLTSGNCLDDEKLHLESSKISEERNSRSSPHGVADQISALEPSQPPERLLWTRKAISPCSQEQLCLAMNSELIDDLENYKCKEKLTFGEHGDSERSCSADASTTKNSDESPRLNQLKIFIGPKQIARRLKTEKRSSPLKGNPDKRSSPPKVDLEKKSFLPNGNLEGPRLSRSLPQLSTGCTSIKRCSESAIAFSQRQMHDMESLALKLMNELKSMKDMVEEKMLFEAYRNSSLKNDADEVKIALKSATKVEETTRKWLSLMSRDCTRFCKIMKLSQNGATVSKNTVHREGRKISFADEAGGMLCHVNYFEDTEPTVESDSSKQEDLIQ